MRRCENPPDGADSYPQTRDEILVRKSLLGDTLLFTGWTSAPTVMRTISSWSSSASNGCEVIDDVANLSLGSRGIFLTSNPRSLTETCSGGAGRLRRSPLARFNMGHVGFDDR